MALFSVDHNHYFHSDPSTGESLRRIETSLQQLITQGAQQMASLQEVRAEFDSVKESNLALKEKVTETVTTLSDLVNRITELEGNTDPAALQALVDDAKAMKADVDATRDALAAAEDAADDHASTPTG